MSQFLAYKTRIKNVQDLCEVLRDYCKHLQGQNFIEVHENPQHLFGYHGDERQDVAHIIIRRKYVGGASNDIGFFRNPDGTYSSIVSEYDRSHGLGKFVKEDLPQRYTELKVKRAIALLEANEGYEFQQATADNWKKIDHPLATPFVGKEGEKVFIGKPCAGSTSVYDSSYETFTSDAASMGY